MQQNYKKQLALGFLKLRNLTMVSIFFLFIISLAFSFTEASQVDDIQAKINSKNDEIQKLEAEIKAYSQSLDKTAEQAASLKNELNSLTLAKKKLETELKKTELNLSQTSTVINKLSGDIHTTEQSIGKNKNTISESIRSMRNEEGNSVIENILASRNISDASNYIENLEKLNVALEQSIHDLQESEATLSTQKSEQETKKTELSKLKKDLSGQQKAVLDTAQEKNKLLTVTKNQQSTYQKILDDKIKLRAQFEQELFKYESDLKIAIDPSKLPTTLKAGVIAWPLQSILITQMFGKTSTSGRLYASGTHNGIDLKASDGTKVMAAFGGTVQATGNTDLKKNCYSYGKWILIKHPNGLSTLYAHLSSQSVSAGDSVEMGDTIGYSGHTGYVTGPHLHLTVLASEGVRVMQYPPEKAINCGGVTIPIADPKAFLDPLLYLPPVPQR